MSRNLPCARCGSSDVDTPFHIGRQDGEAVPQLITVAWREASPAGLISIRTTTPKAVEPFPTLHKDDDPEGGRTVPDIYSTSSRSFPLLSYFRRCRIPRHTAVSVCRTASPSLCIHARPVRVIRQTQRYTVPHRQTGR